MRRALYAKAQHVEHPDTRAGLLHLGDLFRHCPTFYRDVKIPPGDGLPLGTAYSNTGSFSSPAAMCAEG